MFKKTVLALALCAIVFSVLGAHPASAASKTSVQNGTAGASGALYNPDAAVQWANSHHQSDYKNGVCTTLVTLAMKAGGLDIPRYDSNSELAAWLRDHHDLWTAEPTVANLENGDILFWNSTKPNLDLTTNSSNFIDHVILITEKNHYYTQWNPERIQHDYLSSWVKDGMEVNGSKKYIMGVHFIKTTKNAPVPPAPSTKPAEPQPISKVPGGYTFCANENQKCNFSGTQNVIYGANDRFVILNNVTNGVQCNNSVFGDPKYGYAKACYIVSSAKVPSIKPGGYNYQCAAKEEKQCSFSGTYDVAYGVKDKWIIIPNVNGSILCSNKTFGDPYPGRGKSCYYHKQ
jgi:hypothetical protein